MAWKLFTDSEIATILHGLRMIQCEGRLEGCAAGDCDHFDEAPALTNDEIDALCERINLDGAAWDSRAVSNPIISYEGLMAGIEAADTTISLTDDGFIARIPSATIEQSALSVTTERSEEVPVRPADSQVEDSTE